jgi:hypothetical protein
VDEDKEKIISQVIKRGEKKENNYMLERFKQRIRIMG